MKNLMQKMNIFALILVFLATGLFAPIASAQYNGNATFWNGEEHIPINWNGTSGDDDDDDDDDDDNDGEVITLSATNIDDDSAKLRGEVTSGNNIDVWFVIDDNDSTPSCSDGSIDYSVSGDFDDGDTFSRTISGLEEDETYYFRACTDGDSGSIRSFTTDDDNDNNDDDDDYNCDCNDDDDSNADDIVAITSFATGITINSAYLNGLSIIREGGSGKAWFEYGPTTSLGSRTPDQFIGLGSSTISRQLVGLPPNTSYYFRLVVENSRGTDYGDIRSLTTRPLVTTTGTNGGGQGSTTTTTSTTTQSSVFLAIDIEANEDTVSVGDSIIYTATYKNVSSKELKNLTMQVNLPEEIDFDESTTGLYSKSTHSVLLSLSGLAKGASGEFVVTGTVSKRAKGESVIIASLITVHDHPNVAGSKVNLTSYSIVEVDNDGKGNSANSIFSGKFFPTSFIGWLLIALFILLIILVARKLAKDKKEKDEEKQAIKIAR